MTTSPAARNQSTSLRRALSVLDYVRDQAGSGRGTSLTRIAEDLGINKSTVLRLAAPLVEADLLVRDRETGWFRLGHGALRLGQAYLSSLDLRTVAAEPLRQLLQAVDETCHLVVYTPPDVAYIDKLENEPEVRCVAAPIFDHTDGVAGALSVSGLVSRMSPARIREVGPMVVRTGLEISRALGSSRGDAGHP